MKLSRWNEKCGFNTEQVIDHHKCQENTFCSSLFIYYFERIQVHETHFAIIRYENSECLFYHIGTAYLLFCYLAASQRKYYFSVWEKNLFELFILMRKDWKFMKLVLVNIELAINGKLCYWIIFSTQPSINNLNLWTHIKVSNEINRNILRVVLC